MQGNTDTHSDRCPVEPEFPADIARGYEDFMGDPVGPAEIRIRQEDGEFLTADPRRKIPLTDTGRDDPAKLMDDAITRGVAEPVVDCLEMIGIDVEQGASAVDGARRRKQALRLQIEFGPVEQPGQVVPAGFEIKLLGKLLEFVIQPDQKRAKRQADEDNDGRCDSGNPMGRFKANDEECRNSQGICRYGGHADHDRDLFQRRQRTEFCHP